MSNRNTVPNLLSCLSVLAEELKDAHAQLAAREERNPDVVADGPEVADLRKRLKQVEFQLNFERNLSRNLSSTVDSNQVEIDKLKEALQDKDYRLDRALGDVYLLRKQVQELLSWKSDRNARIGIALGLIRNDPYPTSNTLSKVYNLFRDL